MTTLESTAVRRDAPRRSATRSMLPWLIVALALLAVAVVLSL